MTCTDVAAEVWVTSAASTRSFDAPGSEEALGALHATWSADDYAWDGEGLLQALPIPEAPAAQRRAAGPRAGAASRRVAKCHVSGCGVSLAGCSAYLVRYRLCEEHLRASMVLINGVPSRFCQTCSRFQATSLFAGARRTCTPQLEAARTRREARLRRAAAAPPQPPPGAVTVAEDDLLSWLLLPEGATQPLHDFDADVAALLGPPEAERARTVVTTAGVPSVYATSFALKLPYAPGPDALPSAGGAALRAWADDPLLLLGIVQPGCVLLTVDALWAAEPARKAQDPAAMLAALRRCAADATERGALRDAYAVAAPTRGAARLPPPLRCAAFVAPGAVAVTLSLAAPPPPGAQLRARAHGQLLAVTSTGAAVTVQLPAASGGGGDDAPTLLLLDAQDDGGMALAQPRAVLLLRDAAVAAELQAAVIALPSDDAAHALVCLPGSALHHGGARADPGLLAAAAAAAASSGLTATLAALLDALSELPAPYRTTLLAVAAAAAQPAAVALLLRRGGTGELFGAAQDALFAAALAATNAHDEARAVRAVQVCGALTAHGDGGIAWFEASFEVAGASRRRVVTPAQAAARGGGAACVRLCTRLASRRAAAHARIAADAAKLPPGMPRGAALAALLASMPLPQPPGSLPATAGDDAAAEAASTADLALAMLQRAATRHATAVEDAALLRSTWARPHAFVPVLYTLAYATRVLPEPLLSDAQLRAAAEADVQLSTLAHLRLGGVYVLCSQVSCMLLCGLAFIVAIMVPTRVKRRMNNAQHVFVAYLMAITQLAFLWLSLRSAEQLPQPPRVHPAATVAKLLFSAQMMVIISATPPQIAALLYVLRAAIVLAGTLLPRCLFMPRSWLTNWTLLPHVAIHLVAAWRAWRQRRVNLRVAAAQHREKAD